MSRRGQNAKVLKYLYEKTGLKTRAALADALGVSRSKISDIELGRYGFSTRLIARIRERIGVDISEMVLGGEQEGSVGGCSLDSLGIAPEEWPALMPTVKKVHEVYKHRKTAKGAVVWGAIAMLLEGFDQLARRDEME